MVHALADTIAIIGDKAILKDRKILEPYEIGKFVFHHFGEIAGSCSVKRLQPCIWERPENLWDERRGWKIYDAKIVCVPQKIFVRSRYRERIVKCLKLGHTVLVKPNASDLKKNPEKTSELFIQVPYREIENGRHWEVRMGVTVGIDSGTGRMLIGRFCLELDDYDL